MTYNEKIINITTGTETVREYTADEIAAVEAAKLKAESKQIEAQEKAAQKAALLEQLGITAEQAKLLLS
jgi:hypothetical protein